MRADRPESLTRQILREHLAEGELTPGSPIALRVDQALLQDATGTMAFMQYEQLGVPRVRVRRAVQSAPAREEASPPPLWLTETSAGCFPRRERG